MRGMLNGWNVDQASGEGKQQSRFETRPASDSSRSRTRELIDGLRKS